MDVSEGISSSNHPINFLIWLLDFIWLTRFLTFWLELSLHSGRSLLNFRVRASHWHTYYYEHAFYWVQCVKPQTKPLLSLILCTSVRTGSTVNCWNVVQMPHYCCAMVLWFLCNVDDRFSLDASRNPYASVYYPYGEYVLRTTAFMYIYIRLALLWQKRLFQFSECSTVFSMFDLSSVISLGFSKNMAVLGAVHKSCMYTL